jgi:hypothetical protein
MKNRLEDFYFSGVKELYYYVRTHTEHGNLPRATVCLLVQDGKVLARGISICSVLDQFVKVKGRGLAKSRALKALAQKTGGGEILPERFVKEHVYRRLFVWEQAYPLFLAKNEVCGCKEVYMPQLTEFETELVASVYKVSQDVQLPYRPLSSA